MLRDAAQAPTLPGKLPLFGHLPALARDTLGVLRKAQHEIGPVFWYNAGFRDAPTLMVLGEEGFSVLRTKRADSSHMADFDLFLGGSMLTLDGAPHRRVRGVSGPAFTPAGLGRAQVGEIITQTVERRLDTWRPRAQIDVVGEAKVIALEVIFRVMGVEVRDLPDWSRWYGEYTLGAIRLPFEFPGSPRWRGGRARAWLEERIREIVNQARAKDDRDSIVGAMVHGHDEGGIGLSERELIDNLLILGFAGHETTASTMAWSMLYLAQYPEYWDRLCEEATAMDEVPNDYTQLAERAPLAAGVFRESLRLYPPVSTDTRHINAELELERSGYRVPANTIVGTSLMLLSRDPNHYEDPERWLPERWLGLERKPTVVENCQFGGGAHFCLGYHMALLEGTLFLVHAARRLAAWGLRPRPQGPIPKPKFVPLTQPPRKVKLGLA
ncbi:cytochrome P450 [Pseudenhygromyxa sp. WMMC2535]|uniref:cytochrome P450 n=1 Tax=Pseudenhygromyxa sp. WMMC2535 TaxID=2712867 RepID=UPI001554C9EC|nr:cytochrome P450 [Pseudenhygromyxa sp. WMMC2535]NVB41013.1 cytochrome P450 [Pseudenhygromyxa sp. WMMC2535]